VLDQVVKEYRLGPNVIRALNGANLTVEQGHMVAIVGPSGSGKTTLLNILGALDRPDSGRVLISGVDLNGLGERELTAYRRQKVGFVFQTFELIPNLSALENVMLPMEFNGVPPKEREARARQLLEAVGLAHRADHRPRRLSGGEQQRVAIARALANDPAILLADEPTGNLDTATGIEIVGLLHRFAEEGKTVIVVTHDETMAQLADVRAHLRDGVIVETAR
jgi:ABC-type lipoprotein export system ATPase subunit